MEPESFQPKKLRINEKLEQTWIEIVLNCSGNEREENYGNRRDLDYERDAELKC